MKAFMTAVFALSLVGVLAVAAEDKQKDKATAKDAGTTVKDKAPGTGAGDFSGRYTIQGEEMGGKAGTDHKGGYFTFDKGRFGGYGSDKKQFFGGDYKIDTSKTPNTIEWKNEKGDTMRGIIKQEGDTLRIYYAMPGGQVPTGFDKTGENQGSFTLRRDTTGGSGTDKDKKDR